MSPFLLFALAFGLSLLLVPVLRRVAFATGVVAHPAADRWNRQAVPLLGGLALMAGVWVTVTVSQGASRDTLTILGAATALGLVGLFDDVRALRPATKLAWQIIVAAIVVTMDLRLGLSNIVLLDLGLTMLWLVALSNAFNLLDNMDGLAAGIAAIALGFRWLFLAGPGNSEAAIMVVALLGACLGFLVFNFAPARIFMGDAGSMFLGFAVAGTSLVGEWPYSRATSATVFLPLLLTVVPLFDATFVTVARALAGRPVYVGGRDHTSHRLVALGLSERSAVLVLYALAAIGGTVAYTSYRYGWSYGGVLSGLLLLGLLILGTFLSRSVQPHEEPERINALTRFIETSDLGWLRGMATVLADAALVVAAYYTAFLLKYDDGLGRRDAVAAAHAAAGAGRVHRAAARDPCPAADVAIHRAAGPRAPGGGGRCGHVAARRSCCGPRASSPCALATVLVIHLFVVLGMLAATRLSFRVLSQYLAQSSGTWSPCSSTAQARVA